MRALKAAVIIMGVMIVAGTILLAVVVANRLSGRDGPAVQASLGQPAGTRIVSLAGAGDRVAVHVTGGGLPDRILLLDPASGRVVGTLAAEGPPAPPTR
ncbi:DUF6476 family protein [Elioraea sp.]|uniref:DUF6476 family protein n=1 Tax=Elioraea sp. TaxID=2185103 RepID=UPI0025C041C9|nr:DUF6476 family protein [Elioraea sp.]